MVAHLTDQMRHALGDDRVSARPGNLGWSPVRFASIYLLPWPKRPHQGSSRSVYYAAAIVGGRHSGNSQCSWSDLPLAMCKTTGRTAPLFGRMSGRDWGVFVHKHCDQHLRQFGV